MEEMTKMNRNECIKRCEAAFIKYTAKKPVGGVEALRICRHKYRGEILDDRESQDH